MKYLYYKVYNNFRKEKTNSTPAFNAMLALVLIQALNFNTLFIIVRYWFKLSFYATANQARSQGLFLTIIIFAFDYFFLYRDRVEIFNKFKKEDAKKARLGNLITVAYLIISVVLFCIIALLFVPGVRIF